MRSHTRPRVKPAHFLCMIAFFVLLSFIPSLSPLAQRGKEGPVNLTGVSSRQTGDGTVVTVSSDGPLSRAQTWQDEEGFHLSLIDAKPGALGNLPRGVTVRNLGKSLEIVVAVKQGAGVTVDPGTNGLNLIVRGGVNNSQGSAELEPPARRTRAEAPVEQPYYNEPQVRYPRERNAQSQAAPVDSASGQDFQQRSSMPQSMPATSSSPFPFTNEATTPASSATQVNPAPSSEAPQLVTTTESGVAPEQMGAAPAQITVSPGAAEGDGIMSYIFSTTGVLLIVTIGVAALWFIRRREKVIVLENKEEEVDTESVETVEASTALVAVEEPQRKQRRGFGRRKTDQPAAKTSAVAQPEGAQSAEGALEKRAVVPVQPALYGAYRVDQEVGKLVLGQPHRLDVLASRAPDDRRAIETSLMKTLTSPEAGEDGRRRACNALEEYGFVARQCASLLLSHDAYDRASAARVLGEIKAQSSLPFLMEALYDVEIIVRTEAVASLGSLKMPTAIGALLDMARRHPEMPASLLSNALSACSVECMDIFDISTPDRPLLEAGDHDSFAADFVHHDPAAVIEALPEWFESEEMSEAMARLEETDVEARAAAVRRLAQFPVRRTVEALTLIAAQDDEPVVRSAAVASLGEIEHESVFAPVLMAFADEAREVRAAAARALSRMNLDRADAYVRLLETADVETLSKVSVACIKAGMASQAIDRLISEDRRLAYEAFSLLSLLAKSNETEMLLDTISDHPDTNVRLAVVRLLGNAGQPDVANHLRHLAVREGMPEKVRSSLLEVVYKLDQMVEIKA